MSDHVASLKSYARVPVDCFLDVVVDRLQVLVEELEVIAI